MTFEQSLIAKFETDNFEYAAIQKIAEVYMYQFPIVAADSNGHTIVIKEGHEVVEIMHKPENLHFYHVFVYRGDSVLHLLRYEKGIRTAYTTKSSTETA